MTPRVDGDDAATIATNGCVLKVWRFAARRASSSILTITVSLVRTPGSVVAAAKAPRRKMMAQIRRSADAATWAAIRDRRARRGRASLVISPRATRTRSRRVACSAGASPKNTVDTTAPATRNVSSRQSAAGAARFNRLMAGTKSGGVVVITAERAPSRNSRETTRAHAAAASASRRLSVSSCRMMRGRDAPSERRMPISLWRESPRARSRLATLAQPIIRISPKAKNSGTKRSCVSMSSNESVPCRGIRRTCIGLPGRLSSSARPDTHNARAAVAASRDMGGLSRPMISTMCSSVRPVASSRDCSASASGAQ